MQVTFILLQWIPLFVTWMSLKFSLRCSCRFPCCSKGAVCFHTMEHCGLIWSYAFIFNELQLNHVKTIYSVSGHSRFLQPLQLYQQQHWSPYSCALLWGAQRYCSGCSPSCFFRTVISYLDTWAVHDSLLFQCVFPNMFSPTQLRCCWGWLAWWVLFPLGDQSGDANCIFWVSPPMSDPRQSSLCW